MSNAPSAILILTGAGISRESGPATFRDVGGVRARTRIEEVAAPGAFARDPGRVHTVHNARRAQIRAPEVRSDVVRFGEMPMEIERIAAARGRCGLFVAIDTSGAVRPAAGCVAKMRGRARTVEPNPEPGAGSAPSGEAHHGPATCLAAAFVAGLPA